MRAIATVHVHLDTRSSPAKRNGGDVRPANSATNAVVHPWPTKGATPFWISDSIEAITWHLGWLGVGQRFKAPVMPRDGQANVLSDPSILLG